jgi:hypothetical protein
MVSLVMMYGIENATLNFLHGSPNSQEFGLRIGSPMFKARSPFTHLITVQTTHHSKIKTPIPK